MTRAPMFVFAGALVLAACGEPNAPPPPAPEPPPVEAGWTLTSGAEGATLRLEAEDGLDAAIACLSGPARFEAATDRFTPVMSEDRFTVGVGGEAYALAADLQAERERGVEASGDIPADLPDRLEAGGEITFHYGALNLGPFPAVAEADRAAFVRACRDAGG